MVSRVMDESLVAWLVGIMNHVRPFPRLHFVDLLTVQFQPTFSWNYKVYVDLMTVSLKLTKEPLEQRDQHSAVMKLIGMKWWINSYWTV